MSFNRQNADIYLTGEMVISGVGGGGVEKPLLFSPPNLFIQGLAEYVDEISHPGRLWAVFVPRLDGRADGVHVGAGGERLIFNRRPELCHDVLTHPSRRLEFIRPEKMNEFNAESLHSAYRTFASHIFTRFH